MLRTISSFLRALVLSLVIYFVFFFFVPSLSNSYLGLSFSSVRNPVEKGLVEEMRRDETQETIVGAMDAKEVQQAVTGAMEKAGTYTTNEIRHVKTLLSNPELADEVQKAARKGGIFFSQTLRSMLENMK